MDTDVCNFDMEQAKKIAAPFGAGMDRMKEVCGACSAMYMISGLLFPTQIQKMRMQRQKTNYLFSVCLKS